METKKRNEVFDYRALRLLVGLIAFLLPFTVSFLSANSLSSISASYYSNARDAFVGMMFIVGSFLWAYNGHTINEAIASRGASLAAILVALFPTACDLCKADLAARIHYTAAVILFAILAYFCLVPFRKNTKRKGGKKGLRSGIYLACGIIMITCMVVIFIANSIMAKEIVTKLRLTYWGETVALAAFGFAWIIAGKYFPLFVDKEDKLYLFQRRHSKQS